MALASRQKSLKYFEWFHSRSAADLRSLTPTLIKFNRFLKLILIERKPLLACFGFLKRQKWLVATKIDLRKRLNLIDVGVKSAL